MRARFDNSVKHLTYVSRRGLRPSTPFIQRDPLISKTASDTKPTVHGLPCYASGPPGNACRSNFLHDVKLSIVRIVDATLDLRRDELQLSPCIGKDMFDKSPALDLIRMVLG